MVNQALIQQKIKLALDKYAQIQKGPEAARQQLATDLARIITQAILSADVIGVQSTVTTTNVNNPGQAVVVGTPSGPGSGATVSPGTGTGTGTGVQSNKGKLI